LANKQNRREEVTKQKSSVKGKLVKIKLDVFERFMFPKKISTMLSTSTKKLTTSLKVP
jgi:hypothetical protein